MYNIKTECGQFDFLNEKHMLRWKEKFGNCKKGCWEKICEQKDLDMKGLHIKMTELKVEK